MNGWTIFRREFSAYFNSAIAYIFLVVFVVFNNGMFMLQFFQVGKADMRAFFGGLPYALVIFIPAISMRLWAEEKRSTTYEMLLTFPMKPTDLVLGKYLASLAFYAAALASTFTIPAMLAMTGRADPGPIAGGYAGAFFMGAQFLAVGIFISGLCRDQITAFILSMLACFALFFSGTDLFAAVLDGWLPGLGAFVKDYVGSASHLVAFGRGILSAKDVFYYVLSSGVFLFLNGLGLEGRYRPKAKLVYAAAVAVCASAFVIAQWLVSDLPLGRVDMTEGKSHTISAVTRDILRSLKVPVRVKYYVSPEESMPTVLKTLERDVRDKLEELRLSAGGKLEYRVIRLDAGAPEEERRQLMERGVVPFQVESVQRDEVGVKLIYSTMIVEYKEKPAEILPRIIPASLFDFEYQFVSRVYKLTLDRRPRIAVFAPLVKRELPPELAKVIEASGGQDREEQIDPYRTATQLMRNNGYDVSRIALEEGDPIPEATKTLVVLSPGELSARQRWEIARFAAAGGVTIIAAHPVEFTYDRDEKGVKAVPKKLSMSVNEAIGPWGVKIGEDLLFDERSQVISLTTGQRIGPFALEMPVKLPNQIVVDEAAINRSISLTKRLPSLFYLWGAALDVSEEAVRAAGLRHTVLFRSSPRSWRVPFEGQELTDANTAAPRDTTGEFPLAVLLEGQFPAPAAEPPAWKAPAEGAPAEAQKPSAPAISPKPGKAVVLGSARAFSDELIQNPGNLNLFANLIDGLTLEADLISIRTKTAVSRDIRRLSDAEKFAYKIFTVALVPAALAVFALVRFFLRRKEKEIYLAAAGGKR